MISTSLEMTMYRHILIATDGSELANKGLEHGLALAKLNGAPVSIVTVTEDWSPFQMAHETRRALRNLSAISKPPPARLPNECWIRQVIALRRQRSNANAFMCRTSTRQTELSPLPKRPAPT